MIMEIWDLYDEHENKTGETWKRENAISIPDNRFHLVCDILVKHVNGIYLLTKRSAERKSIPVIGKPLLVVLPCKVKHQLSVPSVNCLKKRD